MDIDRRTDADRVEQLDDVGYLGRLHAAEVEHEEVAVEGQQFPPPADTVGDVAKVEASQLKLLNTLVKQLVLGMQSR